MRKSVLLWLVGVTLWGVVLLATACAPDLEVSSEAQIVCRTESDCPSGYVCRTTCQQDKGICIKSGQEDTPPSITNSSLSSPLAKLGDTIRVEFDVDQPLRAEPQVLIEGVDGGRFRLVEGTPEEPNQHYVYEYTAKGSEPEESFTVSIKVVNRLCLTSEDSLGPITFDFSAPLILNVESKQFYVNRNAKVVISFTVSDENFSGDPVVEGIKAVCTTSECTAEPFAQFVKDDTVNPPEYRFVYQPQGDEDEGECRDVSLRREPPEGTQLGGGGREGVWYAARITVVDDAGNEATYEPIANMWCFDFTPPQIENAAVNPVFIRSGDRLALGFRASEPLAQDPEIKLVGQNQTITLIGGNVAGLSYAYGVVIPQDIEGIFGVRVFNLRDLSNNGIDELTLERNGTPIQIVVDNTPPEFLTAPHLVGAQDQYFKAGETLVLEFETDEQAEAEVYLDMGSKRFEFEQEPAEGSKEFAFRYRLEITEDLPEGNGYLRVFVHDLAGNSTAWTAPDPVVIDFTPPSIIEGSDWLLYIKPDWCNLLSSVYTITNGGGALLGFSVSEELAADPVVLARKVDDETTALPCQMREHTGPGFSYLCGSDQLIDGVYAVAVIMQDPSGNQSTEVLSKFIVVDATPPEPLDLDRQTETGEPLVEFRRAPWGMTEGRELVVEGKAGAITDEDAVAVVALSGADPTNAGALGGAEVSEDGSFLINLIPIDLPVVYLAGIDAGCNLGEPRAVRFARWTATFNNKKSGSTGTNPHAAYKVEQFQNALIQQSELTAEFSTEEYQALFDGSSSIAVQTGISWRHRYPIRRFPPQQKPYMVGDPIRGGVVILNGIQGSGNATFRVNQVWRFDGSTLQETTPFGVSPPKLINATAEFFPVFGSALLIGGQPELANVDRLAMWGFNGEAWFELNSQEDAVVPSQRLSHATAYDPLRGRIVLFGGIHYVRDYQNDILINELVNDLWEWDGFQWYRIQDPDPNLSCDSDERPCARQGATMAYSMINQAVLLFGGTNDLQGPLNDTWLWDGNSWQRLDPETSPSPRSFQAMSESPTGGVAIFGGTGDSGVLSDFWIWNGTNWQQYDSPTDRGRVLAGLALDSTHGTLVLFGGSNITTEFDDLWVWNGAAWYGYAEPSSAIPDNRNWGVMITFPTSGVLMYGGARVGGPSMNDWWFWNGITWQELGYSGDEFSVIQPALAFDPATGILIATGGANSIAECAGSPLNSLRFFAVSVPDSVVVESMPAQTSTAMSTCGGSGLYDPITNSALLVGIHGSSQESSIVVYEWNGTDWQELYTVQNVRGFRPLSAAYLPERDAILIPNAGIAIYNLHGAGAPYHRSTPVPDTEDLRGAVAAYLPEIHRIAVFGGQTESDPRDTLLLWDGSDWQTVSPLHSSPPGRTYASFALDAAKEELVLFGGASGIDSNDTWTVRFSPYRKPAAVFFIDYTPSLVQLDAIDGFEIRLTAGGVGYTTDESVDDDPDLVGDPVYGAKVLGWDAVAGTFVELEGCSNQATPDSPEQLVCLVDADQAQRLIFLPTANVVLAVVPVLGSGNGPEEAKIAVSGFTFTVLYQNR